jgi:hypothetical protein
VGKSALSIVEAVAMTSGRSLLGTRPSKPLCVWYWNGEDPAEEIQRRVEATCLAFDVDPASFEGRLFIDSGRRTEIVLASQGKSGTLLANVAADALTDALRRLSIDVLILDPFVSTHRVSENDNMAIDVVGKALGKIADRANCAVEAVHHVRKTGGAEITAEDSRGASSLIAAARSVRVLNPMTKDEAESSGVGQERRFHFRADIDKSNLAPSAKASWFRLANIGLGNGSGGPIDDQDYVGVPKTWEWPDAFAGITGTDIATVQARVTQGRWRKDPQAKDWVGRAVAEALKLNLSRKHDRAKVKTLVGAWLASGVLVEIEGLDDSRRKRIFVEAGSAQ